MNGRNRSSRSVMMGIAIVAGIGSLMAWAIVVLFVEGEHSDSPISQPVVAFMEASTEEIQARREQFRIEEDFYAMVDDLLWYRAEALTFLEKQAFAPTVFRGRGPVRFVVRGEARSYDFRDLPFLDVVVAYRPGHQPLAVAPIEVHRLDSYFRGDDQP